MKRLFRLPPLLIAVASIAAGQSLPPELSALATKAHLDNPVTAWCRGEFRSGRPPAFAVAVAAAAGGGRYVVVESDATITELAPFVQRTPDLSCYTRAEAQKLDDTIGRSDTIHGELVPRWDTAVVCAFVEDTTAVCWQYSSGAGMFVKVGGWMT